ncbi:MAG: sulfite exporter TauE/SafE family protein [Desulfobacterales bacterium]|nr:sulfite exporter TauE/SafE family protein [Desulfobacterales bacterium]MDD4071650.1 sulfite exporter TauE/SafE family protein [Desulfobacterales bacterium]MDD4393561.1 sulfite exporter TauE/SafE family protein [Desulfobacterales bacterium]
METIWIALLSFILSFLFALGGVGSAVALVPVLHWLGIPLNEAKPTGLFVNTVSLIGASISNIKNRKLDFSMGIPIILASVFVAPLGAYVSTFLPEKTVLGLFVLFLLFSGNMMFFFKGSKYADQYRSDRPIPAMLGIGALAGMVSGMLGVGGGGIVSPLMIMLGFNPKKIAAVTAFVVPFSSLTGFIAYWSMGHFNPALVLPVGGAACAGGYLGTHFMQTRLSPATVKRFLALVILGLGIKMLFRLF